VVVIQVKTEDNAFAEGRQALEEWIPTDPMRPVYTAIRAAFIEKFAEYHGLLGKTVSDRSIGRKGRIGPRLAILEKQSMKLAALLFTRANLWVARDSWRKKPIVKFLLRAIRRSPGGRPVSRLRVAVTAKEMRLAEPKKWTWPKITSQLCDCGKEHTIRCQDNLRREVLHLKKMMKSSGCKLTS
jgi:hypothetical protein